MPNYLTTQIPNVIRVPYVAPATVFFTSNTIAQPTVALDYLIPNAFRVPFVPVVVVAPTGVAGWLSNSISQPFGQKQFIPPYDPNQTSYPVNVSTYFKAPATIFVNPGAISQPVTALRYLIPTKMPFIKVATVAPIVPTGVASWLGQSISQPYFPAFDINPSLIAPINVGTYFKAPQAIFFTSNTIAQPTAILDYLIPNVVRVPFIPSAVVVPTGYASWASNTIGQPYMVSMNNQIVTNVSFLRALARSSLVTRLLLGVGL